MAGFKSNFEWILNKAYVIKWSFCQPPIPPKMSTWFMNDPKRCFFLLLLFTFPAKPEIDHVNAKSVQKIKDDIFTKSVLYLLLKSTSVKKTDTIFKRFSHFGNGFLNFIITTLFTMRFL